MNQQTRECVVCGVTKSIDEFGVSGKIIRRQCKVCFYDARRRDRSKLVGRRGRHPDDYRDGKVCCVCGEKKSVDEFYKTARGYPSSYCKPCYSKLHKKYNKRYMPKPVTEEQEQANRKRAKEKSRKFYKLVYSYLSQRCCIDCGETNVVVLEFDHINGDKDKAVSTMSQCSLVKVMEEIEKCEVRCRSCHKKRHSIENNTLLWQLTKNNGLLDDELPD